MARKGRTWSELDRTFVEHLNRKLEARKLSLRKIEAATGISRGRLESLLHMTDGTPTLEEFVALCVLVDENPAQQLASLNSTNDFTLVANIDENRDREEDW